MIRVFAFLDALVILLLLSQLFFPVPWRLALLACGYLLIKAWLFWPDFMSIIDGAVGIVALIGIFITFTPLTALAAFHLGQKAIASLL